MRSAGEGSRVGVARIAAGFLDRLPRLLALTQPSPGGRGGLFGIDSLPKRCTIKNLRTADAVRRPVDVRNDTFRVLVARFNDLHRKTDPCSSLLAVMLNHAAVLPQQATG